MKCLVYISVGLVFSFSTLVSAAASPSSAAEIRKEIEKIDAYISQGVKSAELIALRASLADKLKNLVEKKASAPPVMAKAPAKKPPTKGRKPASSKRFTVQVAAYSQKAEASKEVERLKQKGLSAYAVVAQVLGATWHRVHVGDFGSSKEARAFISQLFKKKWATEAIVMNR